MAWDDRLLGRSRAPETPHPSAPIPVQGPAVGAGLRIPLGESGFSVFPLILGGGDFGWTTDLPTAHQALDRYVELGGNAVHTSDSYGAGRSEHIVGSWIESRGLRESVVVTARVGAHEDHPGLGPVALVRGVEATLTRLRVDVIDVLYLDATRDSTPLEEVLATVDWLVGAGKVRAVGAYGLRPEALVEARIYASAGYPRLTVADVPYNLVRRSEFEGDMRLVVGAQQIALTPSHPLEHGFLSGAQRQRQRIVLSVRAAQLASNLNRRGTRVLRAMDGIGAELGVSNAAIAIAWLLAQSSVVAPIVNAQDADQVSDLVQGVGVRLTRAHLAELARALD
jgi:aryl-alcohol dehydrogenase-like predicted oxidoreductase